MAKTFSYRRLDIVNGSPATDDFKERWPAMFCEAKNRWTYKPFEMLPAPFGSNKNRFYKIYYVVLFLIEHMDINKLETSIKIKLEAKSLLLFLSWSL